MLLHLSSQHQEKDFLLQKDNISHLENPNDINKPEYDSVLEELAMWKEKVAIHMREVLYSFSRCQEQAQNPVKVFGKRIDSSEAEVDLTQKLIKTDASTQLFLSLLGEPRIVPKKGIPECVIVDLRSAQLL